MGRETNVSRAEELAMRVLGGVAVMCSDDCLGPGEPCYFQRTRVWGGDAWAPGRDDEEVLTMEPTSRPPRYVTLRDYLRVLRRYAIPIILIGAIGAAAGLADAKRQTPVYEATASVSFQDPAQDVTLVGLQA